MDGCTTVKLAVKTPLPCLLCPPATVLWVRAGEISVFCDHSLTDLVYWVRLFNPASASPTTAEEPLSNFSVFLYSELGLSLCITYLYQWSVDTRSNMVRSQMQLQPGSIGHAGEVSVFLDQCPFSLDICWVAPHNWLSIHCECICF